NAVILPEGPLAPIATDSLEIFATAVVRSQLGAGAADDADARVIALARPRDAITLWHLAWQGDRRYLDRLAQFVPPGVARLKLDSLDRDAMLEWRERIVAALPAAASKGKSKLEK